MAKIRMKTTLGSTTEQVFSSFLAAAAARESLLSWCNEEGYTTLNIKLYKVSAAISPRTFLFALIIVEMGIDIW